MTDDEAAEALAHGTRLASLGEATAARAVLTPLEDRGEQIGAAALARLAELDEQEGRTSAAIVRWERLLADDIDHPEALAHLDRLAPARGDQVHLPPPPTTMATATLSGPAGVPVQRFELQRELGRGATATVYLARDRTLDLPLALKILHPTGGPGRANVSARRFFNEARTMASLRHPGVVAVYDLDEAAGLLAMEFLPGGSLRDRLNVAPDRRLPPADVARIARGLLSTLAFVHGQGVVHADITPRNILFRDSGQPVLADFGVARGPGAQPEGPDSPGGTPLYLAPEQFRGAAPSVQTDLFAAGAVLWEALAGSPLRTQADLIAGRYDPGPLPTSRALDQEYPRLLRLVAALTIADPHQRASAVAQAAQVFSPTDPGQNPI